MEGSDRPAGDSGEGGQGSPDQHEADDAHIPPLGPGNVREPPGGDITRGMTVNRTDPAGAGLVPSWGCLVPKCRAVGRRRAQRSGGGGRGGSGGGGGGCGVTTGKTVRFAAANSSSLSAPLRCSSAKRSNSPTRFPGCRGSDSGRRGRHRRSWRGFVQVTVMAPGSRLPRRPPTAALPANNA